MVVPVCLSKRISRRENLVSSHGSARNPGANPADADQPLHRMGVAVTLASKLD